MAELILSQTKRFCKVEVNSYVKSRSTELCKSESDIDQQSGYALGMSNDEAVAFLRAFGFKQIIPGTHFATVGDYAKFLGIKKDCLQSYMYRHKLDKPDNPREAISADIADFFRQSGLMQRGRIIRKTANIKDDVFDFRFTESDEHYTTEWNWSTKLYSARCILAIVPYIASYLKPRHPDHPAVDFYENLLWVLGGKRQEAKAQKEKAEREAAQKREALRIKEEEALEKAREEAMVKKLKEFKQEPVSAPAMPVSQYEDILYQMIKRAVSEVLAGARVELTTNTINT